MPLHRPSHPLRRFGSAPVQAIAAPARRRRGLLVGAAALLFSGVAVAALPAAQPETTDDDGQWQALSLAPIARGGGTGMRQSATAAVEAIPVAPERQRLTFTLTYSGAEPFGAMLMRAGAGYADAATAHRMVGKVPGGTQVQLVLGPRAASGRTIMRVDLTAAVDRRLHIARTAQGLSLTTERIAVDSRPVRIRGRAGNGIYWALRAAGASPQAAAEYLRALAAQLDVGSEVGPNDGFDLILAHRSSASGAAQEGPLLYAGLDRVGGKQVQLVRWRSGNALTWVDANADQATNTGSGAMMWPAAGRLTSGFGYRRHPILGYSRLHAGIDIAAPSGTPIVAAAAGQVTAAGWAGGSGRMVRISHGGGIATSYAHMSAIAAEPGSFVRQGQVIGYVGSSGLSTGAHVHYSVYVSGQPVNPMTVRLSAPAPVDTRQISAVRQRLKALLGVGTQRV
ncbi:M23 family metallopeptidase [Sphingomonas piscis]|uniref:M23 family metallopeptidase n=1 Tax=Sphingomonas piscis TaxID=2714943 RepID=A0A6G7YQC4_9SPHN|nr:M23 family metallopeptidase [Sphingomonas piscis]QIK78948.1 M23 family metallopeptidase [Sphingomonas piscis]